MLVIRRRPGEALVLLNQNFDQGEDIEIEILDASSSYVKLGIRAPKSVAVLRKEIRVVGDQNRVASRTMSPAELNQVLATIEKRRSHNP